MRPLLLFLLVTGCDGWTWSWETKHDGVDHIKIPHDRHAKAGVECLTCHDAIWDAKSLSMPTLPDEAKCLECHRAEKERGNCAFCHSDAKHAAPWPSPEPSLKMDHTAHIERTKEKCEVCHQQLPNPVRTASSRPTMDSCTQCHQHKEAFNQSRCSQCHTALTHYQLRPVSLYSHQGDFLRDHGRAANESCASCHEQTFCADCHAQTVSTKVEIKYPERVDRLFIHRDDFLGRHSLEARFDGASCRRCHGSSFCADCHQKNNLTPQAQTPRDPHPPGWAVLGAGSEFHGTAARNDITSCAGCHDQGAQSICVQCHKVGGIGGNPHPAGWTARHGHDQIASNNLCLTCH